MKLTGRVRSKPDARTLRFADLRNVPEAPASYMAVYVARWPVLGNKTLPCCTCAAAAHMIHNWTAANKRPVLLTEKQVVATFVVVSGGAPDGAAMLDVLRLWRRSGLGDRRLRAYVALDAHNEEDLRKTVYLFGAAYIGLDMPDYVVDAAKKDATSAAAWELRPGGAKGVNAPREKNGHCVAVVGYDVEGLSVVSCGVLRRMSWEFYRAYNDEAYAVLSPDWYGNDARSPNGLELAALDAEIAALQARIAQPVGGR